MVEDEPFIMLDFIVELDVSDNETQSTEEDFLLILILMLIMLLLPVVL